MNGKSKCDSCINYIYDEEYDCYICQVNLDEDEMMKFLSYYCDDCPHFRFSDEYKTAGKQM